MKQIERIKALIADISDPMEMAGCLDGIKIAARLASLRSWAMALSPSKRNSENSSGRWTVPGGQ